MKKLNINEWAEADRPREKLIQKGPAALSDAELLAILIGSGSADESAVALMRRLLHDCNDNLHSLGKRTLDQLMDYKGIGQAKAVSILAACELGRRRQQTEAEERQQINSSDAIYQLMRPQMQDLDVEEAWVLLLNHNYRLIKYLCLSRGGITETAVDVRLIVKEALLANATVVAICHNHPSGNLRPSRDDDQLTKRVNEACQLMRLHLLDHVIITERGYYSYHDQGRL